MKIRNKQFVITKSELRLVGDWIKTITPNGLFMYRCPAIKYQECFDKNNNKWILIGVPTLLLYPDSTPEEQISLNETNSIESLTMYWGGRWVLISSSKIISDASVLLGLYFNQEKSIISSSSSLIAEIECIGNSNHKVSASFFNWILAPHTQFSNVFKLLPSQEIVFNAKDFTINPKQILLNIKEQTYEDIYNKLELMFKNEVIYLNKFYNINIALSSGYDSRLIFSVAKSVLKENEIKTYTHLYSKIKPSDKKIPLKISKHHSLIKPLKFNTKTAAVLKDHTGLNVLDADYYFISNGQWDNFSREDICLRGCVLELAGRSGAHLYKQVPNFMNSKEDSKILLYGLSDFRDFQMKAADDYFYWTNEKHPLLIDAKKRMYWEQRVGAWTSYIEQSLDLFPCTSINIGNSLYGINLLINIPEPLMDVKAFHLDFIAKNTPELLNYKFNYNGLKDNLFYYWGVVKARLFNLY